jgi:hypothetical protein
MITYVGKKIGNIGFINSLLRIVAKALRPPAGSAVSGAADIGPLGISIHSR